MTTLLDASRQWSTRPPDERYGSLDALHTAALVYREHGAVARIPYRALGAQAEHEDVVLVNRDNGIQARLTHWAFGQVCQRAGAPASYLRALPAALAADCLTHGLAASHDGDETAQVLVHRNGGPRLVRAITSERYSRIYNADVTERLVRLVAQSPEWQPAPAAQDGSRGLYLSDHDMFAFLVDSDRRVFERAPGGGLGRGFFVWNSEVGAATFGVTTFLYEYVCGNHRVWGAQGVRELRLRHIGAADRRAFGLLAAELRRYADASASDEEARIVSAQRYVLGGTKEEVLDRVFALRLPDMSRKRADEAFERATAHADWYGNPRSAWGFTGGLTEIARDLTYTDERVGLERAAGRILALAS